MGQRSGVRELPKRVNGRHKAAWKTTASILEQMNGVDATDAEELLPADDEAPGDEAIESADDDAAAIDPAATIVSEDEDGDLDTELVATDNVGEQSVEINVESLIAELEAEGVETGRRPPRSARRRLEDLLEQKRVSRELADFDDFGIEDGTPSD